MNKIIIPEGISGSELHKFLYQNKAILIAQKKYDTKKADAVLLSGMHVTDKGTIIKSPAPVLAQDLTEIERSLVINTTNLFDSHDDVHLPGIWNKSLKENKLLYLLQEHTMSFKNIITDAENIKAFTQSMSWTDLGYNAPGITEALIFNAKIQQSRNPFMFDQYRQGWVKNHSVGMRYVVIDMAINDSDYKDEFAVWNKYIDQIVNKQDAVERGYFFAVKEAKIIEGSAVPIGSNFVTPTLQSLKSQITETQPDHSTVIQPIKFDIAKAIRETQFIN
jgi:hypothetical protein